MNNGNQVMERIAMLEEDSRQKYNLIEQKKKECQLLQDENRQLQRQLESAKRELYRLKETNYLIAV